jgi:hypothetical protein
VDEQGWDKLNDLLAQTLDQAMQIQADSASRAVKAETDRFGVNVVIMSHPTPSSAKQSTAPSSGARKKGSSKRKTAAKA